MKKLFTLVALAGLGLSTIGCENKSAAPPPKAAPESTPAPGPTGGEKTETPAAPTDAAKEGEAK